MRIVGFAAHLLLLAAAVIVTQVATSALDDAPLRHALVAMVAILAAVSLLGRAPWGLGPVADPVAARAVRMLGLGLAGVGAFGVVHGFGLGGPPSERAGTGVPVYTVLLSLYFAAVLAATRRGSGVQPRVLVRSAGLGLVAAALWAAAVPVLPPGIVWLGFLLVIAAGFGAALLARPIETGFVAGLVAVVIGAQVLVLAAAVMLHYGPDAWMAYAGPGPLTPQGQLEQNRAEAFDPYVGLAFLGALGAAALIGAAVTARLRERAETPAVLNA